MEADIMVMLVIAVEFALWIGTIAAMFWLALAR